MATLIPAVYQVQLPQQVNDALEFFRLAIELDAWSIHLSCYGDSGIDTQIVFLMTWPIIAISSSPLFGLFLALLFKQTTLRELWALGWQRRERSFTNTVLLQYALPFTMLVLFFAFPPVTALAFRMFEPCTTFSDEVGQSQRWLVSSRKHYAVVCPSPELAQAQSVAWVAILLYPVGVIVLSAWLLYLGRQTLLLEDENTPYTRAISFLHAPFAPSYFYFDLLELSKKLLLIGFASLVEPGSLVQIMMAVVVSLLFLVLHLQASPYRTNTDNILATMMNLCLCMFFFWSTLLQMDVLGDIETGRLDSTGSAVSLLMLISVVGVLAVAILLFVLEVTAKTATERANARRREKWAGCTIEPPTTTWPADKGYACFLSHYKMEAASDARLLHDMVAKMLRYPVFLDSANLTDLRQLITNGVADSDVLLILGTKGFITRPWCLLEIVHATRLKVPIMIINVKNSGFDSSEAQCYVEDLEDSMDEEDLELLHEHLGPDLHELKVACTAALVAFSEDTKTQLVWNPNASDSELIACLKDIIDTMAGVKGSTLKWKGDIAKEQSDSKRASKRNSRLALSFHSRRPEADATALHLICRSDEALNEARVLQTELAIGLERLVSTSAPKETDMEISPDIMAAQSAEAVAVLLTKNCLRDPCVLVELYHALQQGKPIVPICLVGRGYDFKEASDLLGDLGTGLTSKELVGLNKALTNLSDGSVEDVRAALATTLPRLIAVNWEPEGGKNQLDATVTNVLARFKILSTASALKRAVNASKVVSRASTSVKGRKYRPSNQVAPLP